MFIIYIVLIIAYVLSIFISQKVLEVAKSFYYKVLQTIRLLYYRIFKCKLKSHKCNFNFKNNFKRSNNFA